MYENTAAFFPDRTERERRTGGAVVSSRRLLTTLVSGTRTRKHLRTNLFGGAASEWPKAERKRTAADEKNPLVGRRTNYDFLYCSPLYFSFALRIASTHSSLGFALSLISHTFGQESRNKWDE